MKKTVNLYITFGTLPALFSQINLFIDKNDSYFWGRSVGDFSFNNAPKNLKYFKILTCTDKEFIETVYKDITSQIIRVLSRDKNSKFVIYTDDSRVQFVLKPLIKAGIFDNKIERFVIISEGNITEELFRALSSDSIDALKKKWVGFIRDIKSGTNVDDDLVKIDGYAFGLSMDNNVEYYIPHPNVLENKSIIEEKRNMHLKDINLENRYIKLSADIRKMFVNDGDDVFCDDRGKYIIVLGTYMFGSDAFTSSIYISLLEQFLEDISDKYQIFFKPHPVFKDEHASQDIDMFYNYLAQNNITVLPKKLPVEVLLWNHPNMDIAGFSSSANAFISKSRINSFFGCKIGYAKLLFRGVQFKQYNAIISQKMAQALSYDYGEIRGVAYYVADKVWCLEQQNSLLADRVLRLEKKLSTRVKNKLVTVAGKIMRK
jgi:hypothetical protein